MSSGCNQSSEYYYHLDRVLVAVESGPAGAVRTGSELMPLVRNSEFYVPAKRKPPTMQAQTNFTLCFRASTTIKITAARNNSARSTVMNREAGVTFASRQKFTRKSVTLCM
jgi:hypothetical protein